LADKVELLRELDTGLTTGLFERCLAAREGTGHRRLVGLDGLSRGQVEQLAQTGAKMRERVTRLVTDPKWFDRNP
jgi:hypothetical protein